MHTLRSRIITILVLIFLILSACNMPRSGATPTASGVDLINTAAAQTVAARLTQAAQPPPTSSGVPATPIPPTSEQGSTPAAPTTTPGGATASTTAAAVCDRVKFVEDVTYPDNSEVAAGQSFVKTWRLQNDGTCTWTTSYALVFAGKERLGAPDAVPLAGSVAPGQTIDVSVTLTAPTTGGTYRADFKLRNGSNETFGIGAQNEPFYVQVEVPGAPVASGIVFDFISQAANATWVSGAGDTLDTNLTIGGTDDDPNGTAAIRDGVKLETGAISGKILLTVPKHNDNGLTVGTYPNYTVQAGDRLKARLGFLANADGNCGEGNVNFQVGYVEGNTFHLIDEWEKTCTGNFVQVDIDLSDLRGKTVKFVLAALANGPVLDDWAIWNSARIEHE
jgi:hypothetical protein